MPSSQWTNESVLRFAEGVDPVEAITHHSRELVIRAMDAGWSGPPFEPLELARHLNIEALPRDDVRDARTVPVGDKPQIEFNPNRPRGRMRYSIAHEIAHTFFPDCTERIRNRAKYHELSGDDWQVEALCNIAAAELVMPFATLPTFDEPISIDVVLEMRAKFDVSAESVLIRIVRMVAGPYAAFCASRLEEGPYADRYRVDYVIPGSSFHLSLGRGFLLPAATILVEVSGIGYTAKGDEIWPAGDGESLHIEAVGIPPYPGLSSPRVVGLLRPASAMPPEPALVTYLKGDATEPRGTGKRLIVQVVNDTTAKWGGRGFATALLRKYPEAQASFLEWVDGGRLRLGMTHFCVIGDSLVIASIVAQSGFGPSIRPRIRYAALKEGLTAVAEFSATTGATIHMPRIGCGQAGGKWEIVETLLSEVFSSQGVQITVYDPPERRTNSGMEEQKSLLRP